MSSANDSNARDEWEFMEGSTTRATGQAVEASGSGCMGRVDPSVSTSSETVPTPVSPVIGRGEVTTVVGAWTECCGPEPIAHFSKTPPKRDRGKLSSPTVSGRSVAAVPGTAVPGTAVSVPNEAMNVAASASTMTVECSEVLAGVDRITTAESVLGEAMTALEDSPVSPRPIHPVKVPRAVSSIDASSYPRSAIRPGSGTDDCSTLEASRPPFPRPSPPSPTASATDQPANPTRPEYLAAGVLPFCILGGDLLFLLGQQLRFRSNSRSKSHGFGGQPEGRKTGRRRERSHINRDGDDSFGGCGSCSYAVDRNTEKLPLPGVAARRPRRSPRPRLSTPLPHPQAPSRSHVPHTPGFEAEFAETKESHASCTPDFKQAWQAVHLRSSDPQASGAGASKKRSSSNSTFREIADGTQRFFKSAVEPGVLPSMCPQSPQVMRPPGVRHSTDEVAAVGPAVEQVSANPFVDGRAKPKLDGLIGGIKIEDFSATPVRTSVSTLPEQELDTQPSATDPSGVGCYGDGLLDSVDGLEQPEGKVEEMIPAGLLWSDFGGAREARDVDAEATASREFAEESLGLFHGVRLEEDSVARSQAEMEALLRDPTLRGKRVFESRNGGYVMFMAAVDFVPDIMMKLARKEIMDGHGRCHGSDNTGMSLNFVAEGASTHPCPRFTEKTDFVWVPASSLLAAMRESRHKSTRRVVVKLGGCRFLRLFHKFVISLWGLDLPAVIRAATTPLRRRKRPLPAPRVLLLKPTPGGLAEYRASRPTMSASQSDCGIGHISEATEKSADDESLHKSGYDDGVPTLAGVRRCVGDNRDPTGAKSAIRGIDCIQPTFLSGRKRTSLGIIDEPIPYRRRAHTSRPRATADSLSRAVRGSADIIPDVPGGAKGENHYDVYPSVGISVTSAEAVRCSDTTGGVDPPKDVPIVTENDSIWNRSSGERSGRVAGRGGHGGGRKSGAACRKKRRQRKEARRLKAAETAAAAAEAVAARAYAAAARQRAADPTGRAGDASRSTAASL